MLVDPISDMIPTKDKLVEYICMSFQDIFDVVLCHKPLSCSNPLKFSRVFFEVFIQSPGQFYIDFKALDLANLLSFCFSER